MTDDARALAQGWTRETTIERDAEGRWFQDGQRLQHPNLERAFDAWVDVADDGRFILKNDVNWAYVTLHGAPVFVRAARLVEGEVRLTLSDGREESLEVRTLRTGPDGALYCDVRGGRLTARFDRHAVFGLEPVLAEDAEGAFVALGGAVVRPPRVADPLAPAGAAS